MRKRTILACTAILVTLVAILVVTVITLPEQTEEITGKWVSKEYPEGGYVDFKEDGILEVYSSSEETYEYARWQKVNSTTIEVCVPLDYPVENLPEGINVDTPIYVFKVTDQGLTQMAANTIIEFTETEFVRLD